MKYYPYLIIISILITSAHFLFVSAPANYEWFVWDVSQAIAGTSILTAYIMYATTAYNRVGLKLLMLVYLILCSISTISYLYEAKHLFMVDLITLVFIALYWLYKANKWNLHDIKGDKVSDEKIMFVFKRPESLLTWISSLLGYGYGSMFVVYGGYTYYMSAKTNKFTKTRFIGLAPNEIAFDVAINGNELDWDWHITNEDIKRDIEKLIDTPFSPVYCNCLTILESVIIKYGIVRPESILPSQYIKKFL